MARRTVFVFVVLVGTVSGASARAGISAFWQAVPITPEAIADDPQLATMQTWDLMVTTDGDWASAGLRGTFEPLSSARWYHHPLAGNTRPDPTVVAASPAAEYDTFVTAPGDDGVTGAPFIFGAYPSGTVPSFGDLVGSFAVEWGHGTTVLDPPGTYQIARWTFPHGRIPTIYWFLDPPRLPGSSYTGQVSPDAFAIIPQIPEPALATIVAIACVLTRQRHRKHSGDR